MNWEVLLADLPDRACVAFAARCARRVQPGFLEDWSEAPQSLCKLVEKAIALAENCAVNPGEAHSTSTFALNARAAAKAASQADAELAAHVASTAAYATYAATAIGYANCSAAHAVEAAQFAVHSATADRLESLLLAMQRDIDCLRAAMARGDIDSRTPVSPDLFGPLWTEGDPVSA